MLVRTYLRDFSFVILFRENFKRNKLTYRILFVFEEEKKAVKKETKKKKERKMTLYPNLTIFVGAVR